MIDRTEAGPRKKRRLGRRRGPAEDVLRKVQLMIEDHDGMPSLTRFPGLPTNDPHGNLPIRDADETLAVLLPLLILLSTLLFLLILFILFLILVKRKRGIALSDDGGPLNLEDEDEIEGEGGLEGVEQRWLEHVDQATKIGYERAKLWQQQYPPNSDPTDITLSQFLTIQEKGISAWSFEPDYESNSAVFVQGRTELSFLADGTGMSGDEGGGCSVLSNLPVPKVNETYYFECKLYEKPEGTNVSIGLATKPYPTFRLPGWNKYSVAYFSQDGFKSHSYPFTGQSYGPPLYEGDVLGVGYRPRTGTVFFTRNGKKLEDAYTGLTRYNLFPAVGATGSCEIHVNLGQAGFVFIEANVKKWGLAPAMGTLAPPPAYGSERGSILLAAAPNGTPASSSQAARVPTSPQQPSRSTQRTPRRTHHRASRPQQQQGTSSPVPPPSPTTAAGAVSALASTQPTHPSPLRHARKPSARSALSATSCGGRSSSNGDSSDGSEGHDRNPPTPGLLDISLQSIHRFPQTMHSVESDDEEDDEDASSVRLSRTRPTRQGDEQSSINTERSSGTGSGSRTPSPPPLAPSQAVEPPAYHPVDPYMYAPGVAEALLEDSSYAHRPGFGSPSSVPSDSRYEATTSTSGSGMSSWWNWLSRGASADARSLTNSVRGQGVPQQQQQQQQQQRLAVPTSRPPRY